MQCKTGNTGAFQAMIEVWDIHTPLAALALLSTLLLGLSQLR